MVGFPPHEMIQIEKDFFPNYTEGYQHIYLSIRNMIVSKWKRNVTYVLPPFIPSPVIFFILEVGAGPCFRGWVGGPRVIDCC